MRNEMTRYSSNPDKQNRKNTLVTIRDGDTIFFGIARCNKKAGDSFTKKQGQVIAKARALRAQIEFNPSLGFEFEVGSAIHDSMLRGWIAKDDVHKLLHYFRNVDAMWL